MVSDQGDVPSFLEEFIMEAASKPGVTTGVSGLVMFVSAFGVFAAVREGVNIMWGSENQPGFFTQRITEAAMMVFGSVLLFTSLAISTLISFIGVIGHLFIDETDFIDHLLIDAAGFAITLAINFAVFLVHYQWLPHAKVWLVAVLPTAFITALVFELVKHAFIFYLHHGAERFLRIYWSIATLMMMIMFFYAQANIRCSSQ